ncbi:MAG: PspC domain-containing protein [Lachnospiraceae bacterium]|nr:PspC domain-containing protein [Lachnospiraceae bacterium]
MGNDFKKLVRSKENRMLCGVCGGVGEYLNVDPTIVRLIWLLCSMASCGTGLLVYIIAAIVIPEDNTIVG